MPVWHLLRAAARGAAGSREATQAGARLAGAVGRQGTSSARRGVPPLQYRRPPAQEEDSAKSSRATAPDPGRQQPARPRHAYVRMLWICDLTLSLGLALSVLVLAFLSEFHEELVNPLT